MIVEANKFIKAQFKSFTDCPTYHMSEFQTDEILWHIQKVLCDVTNQMKLIVLKGCHELGLGVALIWQIDSSRREESTRDDVYRNDPKFSDRYAWANSADPDQTAPRGAVWSGSTLPFVCIVWTHYSMVEPHSSNFRVITTNILGVRIFRKFTVLELSRPVWVVWSTCSTVCIVSAYDFDLLCHELCIVHS